MSSLAFHGSFNICLPVYIDNWRKRPGGRVMIRFPLPFKVGDSNYPGNAEEKMRCEAATYTWIRETCPDFLILVVLHLQVVQRVQRVPAT
jgi:hypothetical protein